METILPILLALIVFPLAFFSRRLLALRFGFLVPAAFGLGFLIYGLVDGGYPSLLFAAIGFVFAVRAYHKGPGLQPGEASL